MAGIRLFYASQPESGSAVFLQVASSVGLGALLGTAGVILTTELQRAAKGALIGIPVGIGVGILASFGLNLIPPLPSVWQPFLVGTVVVAGVIVSAALLEDMF